MAIKPMSPKGVSKARTAVVPQAKQPIKPGAGRIPRGKPTIPAPRPGVARTAVVPSKQAPTAKIMPVGKTKPPVNGGKSISKVANTEQQMKNATNIKKSKMVSKSVSSRNKDIMKALGK